MTDLEMTQLCAEAMGWRPAGTRKDFDEVKAIPVEQFKGAPHYQYGPLKDDSACMSLIKRFGMDVTVLFDGDGRRSSWRVVGTISGWDVTEGKDLNRAIVECVAKGQKFVKRLDMNNYRPEGK